MFQQTLATQTSGTSAGVPGTVVTVPGSALANAVHSPPALTGQKETAGVVGRTAIADVGHHTSSAFSKSRRVEVGK